MRLVVNGKSREYAGAPFKRLIDVLREDLGLTGTKEGCGEGECGACTVLLDGRTVNACLIPIVQVEGRKIETIEAMGSPERLHPVQSAFLEKGGSQCGICTPGMVVAAAAWIKAPGPKTARTCRQALAGNLCRCTGYQPIVDSVLAACRPAKKGRRRARKAA